ncbi:unnamed protein product [Triticum turgidum subsp. durum]|uniref:Uncharacterized protein n=1 Tax=Triticum turgidum subsp. durum TaxID=4567 RepID=A0A9R1QHN4_TRITD|nr:unnamed protein product [Triticum turgidum subsp. durum]
MPRKHLRDGNAAYDTGSSLHDSYELASLNRILDRHLAVAGPPSPRESRREGITPTEEGKNQQVVAFRARPRPTLRALFRGVTSWAVRPRTQTRACACVGVAPARTSAVGSERW